MPIPRPRAARGTSTVGRSGNPDSLLHAPVRDVRVSLEYHYPGLFEIAWVRQFGVARSRPSKLRGTRTISECQPQSDEEWQGDSVDLVLHSSFLPQPGPYKRRRRDWHSCSVSGRSVRGGFFQRQKQYPPRAGAGQRRSWSTAVALAKGEPSQPVAQALGRT